MTALLLIGLALGTTAGFALDFIPFAFSVLVALFVDVGVSLGRSDSWWMTSILAFSLLLSSQIGYFCAILLRWGFASLQNRPRYVDHLSPDAMNIPAPDVSTIDGTQSHQP